MAAKREEAEGEPYGGAFHKEPGERWRDGGSPPWTVVFAIRSLEESERDEGWWSCDVEGEETVVKESLV